MANLRSYLKLARSRSHAELRLASVLVTLYLALGSLAVSGATFSATLDHDTITLGENVTLSLTFEGGTPQAVPNPPAIPNLTIAYVGPSSQFSFINGQV